MRPSQSSARVALLPPVAINGRSTRLPITTTCCAALAQALLDDGAARNRRLSEACHIEPALAIWCWGQMRETWQTSATPAASRHAGAAKNSGAAASTLRELAETISPGLVHRLSRDGGVSIVACASSAATAADRLASAGVALAEAAAKIAARRKVSRERAYMLGLIHNASNWENWRPRSSLGPTGSRAPKNGGGETRHLGNGSRQDSLPPRNGSSAQPLVWQKIIDEALRTVARRAKAKSVSKHAHSPAQTRHAIGKAIGSDGEVKTLIALLNRLAHVDKLETRFDRAVEEAKLVALIDFAAGAGHELNNPLANISGRAQMLLREETDSERQRRLATIVAQAQRASEMITDLMFFARPPAPRMATMDLMRAVSAAIESQRRAAESQGTRLTPPLASGPIKLVADESLIVVALQAMLRNAIEAVAGPGEVIVAVETIPIARSRRREATVSIVDTGPGVSPEARPHLFNPFYSGREAGRGLGFGLCKAWRIASLHGGRIEVGDGPGGARFTLALPAV